MRTLVFAILLLPACLFSQTAASNLSFEAGTLGGLPDGWTMGSVSGPGFNAALVDQNCKEGQRCVMLTGPATPVFNSYGVLSQTIRPVYYGTQKVRFRAAVHVQGNATRARLQLQIGQTSGLVAIVNSADITSADWNYYEVEADAITGDQYITLMVLIYGSGSVWVDDVTFIGLTADPPSPADIVANLTAFAKLFGYVRHFHPSDQAAATDWDKFAVEGARAVETASTPEDLAQRLRTLFDPIAPTVRIYATGSRPDIPSELRPGSLSGLSCMYWNHFGVGLGNDETVYGYHQERLTEPTALSPVCPDPASPYEAALGRGLSASVPLGLYADAGGTLPHQALPAASQTIAYSPSDRAVRIAGVVLAWNVFQHFYPYFDVVKTDWPAALSDSLRRAATDETRDDYQETLERLVAALNDGHGHVYPFFGSPDAAPLVWDWVDGQLIVTRIKDDQQQNVVRGDRVLKIDGTTVEAAMAAWQPRISAATPQWKLLRTLQSLAYCNGATGKMRLEIEAYSRPGTSRTVEFTCLRDFDWFEPRGPAVQTLEPGIMYIDINTLTEADWTASLSDLVAARGIVFDLRGYSLPEMRGHPYLLYLSETELMTARANYPQPIKPDRQDFRFLSRQGSMSSRTPYLAARRVFLADGRTISNPELPMSIVEYHKLGEIVGGPTAGTNGGINPFTVPGGYTLWWTGVQMLKQDGSQHHGIGIRPTIPATRTRKGIAEGRDEVLLEGLRIVKGAQPGPMPAITAAGVVNAASYAQGPVAPGEIVTIFGTDLGPATLAQGKFDESGFLSNYAGETRVFFDNIQAPLVYALSMQVSAIVPYKLSGQTTLRVEYQLRNSNEITLQVAPAAPGIFGYAGQSRAVVVNQDQTFNSAENAAARGDIVTVFATGEGAVLPAVMDGRVSSGLWPAPTGDVAVTFGGVAGEVVFKGQISPGVLQVNVKVPAAVTPGNAVAIALTVGGAASAGHSTIAIR